MRYRGQSYELSLPCSRCFEEEFHLRHEQRYGYADPAHATEIVTPRVRVRGLTPKPRLPAERPAGPAIVFEYSATTAVPPDYRCRVDRFHNLEITLAR